MQRTEYRFWTNRERLVGGFPDRKSFIEKMMRYYEERETEKEKR